MRAGESDLRWSKVSFGPDHHEHACRLARLFGENLLQVARARLQRADQSQVETGGRQFKELVCRLWEMHLGKPILAALFRGLQGDGLPLCLFLCGTLGIELNYRARGEKRKDFGCSNLDRFLHDQVHVFSFRDGLRECEAAAKRRSLGDLDETQLHRAGTERGYFGDRFPAVAVENGEAGAGRKTENVASMMRFGSAQGGG